MPRIVGCHPLNDTLAILRIAAWRLFRPFRAIGVHLAMAAIVLGASLPAAWAVVGPGEGGFQLHQAAAVGPLGLLGDRQAEEFGLRHLAGRHLLLYTDVDADPQVDVLPRVFDQATDQWCRYFKIRPVRAADWRIRGCLMREKRPFAACGLLPAGLPPFRHGFSRGRQLWLNEQPTAYYRRHLLLHEGTHAFMDAMFGGCGPPWYMEGMAELLATHSYRDGKLVLNSFPARREDVPMLGRIVLVQQDVAAGRARSLADVLAIAGPEFLHNEAYAWSWALAALLDGHPRYQTRFRRLPADVRRGDFTQRFRARLAADWGSLSAEWQLFAGTLQYGHDIVRTAIDFRSGQPLIGRGDRCAVAADRGWQSSGWWLAEGRTYQIQARGRYQIAKRPKIWWCEPDGVTIRYFRGRPLGQLLGTIVPKDHPAGQPTPFLTPFVVGTRMSLTPQTSGTLYLKINDSPAELADNAGPLNVTVVAP